MKLRAWLQGGRVVWLKGYNGALYQTIAHCSPERSWAHVYPGLKIGEVVLKPDYTTGGESIYIEEWAHDPADFEKRAAKKRLAKIEERLAALEGRA